MFNLCSSAELSYSPALNVAEFSCCELLTINDSSIGSSIRQLAFLSNADFYGFKKKFLLVSALSEKKRTILHTHTHKQCT